MIPRYLTPRFLAKKGRNSSWRQQGDNLRDLGHWVEAAKAYGRHLEQYPTDSAIWIQCGHMLKEAGQLDRAVASYNRSEELDPGDKERDTHLFHLRERLSNMAWTPDTPIEEDEGEVDAYHSSTARPMFMIPNYVAPGPCVIDASLIAGRLRKRS